MAAKREVRVYIPGTQAEIEYSIPTDLVVTTRLKDGTTKKITLNDVVAVRMLDDRQMGFLANERGADQPIEVEGRSLFPTTVKDLANSST